MNKFTKFKKSLPILVPSGILYLASGLMVPQFDGIAKTLLFLLFFASFAAFGGTIVNLLDLKYIGKGFIK